MIVKAYISENKSVLQICEEVAISIGNEYLITEIKRYSYFTLADIDDISIIIDNITVIPNGMLSVKLLDGWETQFSINHQKSTSLTTGDEYYFKGYCNQCGKRVNQNPKRKQKLFCSDSCRMLWWNKHRECVNNKNNVTELECPHCHKIFEDYGNTVRKYCSHECYIADRFEK